MTALADPKQAVRAQRQQPHPGLTYGSLVPQAAAAGLNAIMQPAPGHCWFGAYPGGGNKDPNATYNGGTWEGATMSDRVTGCWYRYYVVTQTGIPTADDKTLCSAGRVLVMSLATAYSVPSGGCGNGLTVAAGSNGVPLSSFTGSGVLNVNAAPSSNAYPSSGTLDIVLTDGSVGTVTYTGTSGNTFTGCTATVIGSGDLATGNGVATQYSWAAAANGAYDSQITRIGTAARALPDAWFCVWSHEPDVAASKFGTPAAYVAAFQHVSALLRSVCGTGNGPGNVVMAWVLSSGSAATAAYYPGDDYTDWMGVDPYDPTLAKGSPSATYTPYITFLNTDPLSPSGGAGSGGGHGKPLGIFETGVEPAYDTGTGPGTEAYWISRVPATLASLETTWGSQFQLWQWFNDLTGTWNTAITPGGYAAAALAGAGATGFFTITGATASVGSYSTGRISANYGALVRNPDASPKPGPPFYPASYAAPQGVRLPPRGVCRAARFYPPAPSNPTAGPVFQQATAPIRAPVPQVWSKGRIASSPGAPPRNPAASPAFRQAASPARIRPGLPPRGRVTSGNPGAPVRNPGAGPVFRQARTPARIRVVLPPRGRISSYRGAPVNNPGPAFSFRQANTHIGARIPLNAPRGRAHSNPGAPVRNQTAGPVFRQAATHIRARIPQSWSKGRTGFQASSNPGAPVRNPAAGPVFRPFTSPVQARFPLPRRGTIRGNPGGPVRNTPIHESGPFHIWLPGGCLPFGTPHVTLPAPKVTLRGVVGEFGPFAVTVPPLKVSLLGKYSLKWPGVTLPSLRTSLAGEVTHNPLKVTLPPPRPGTGTFAIPGDMIPGAMIPGEMVPGALFPGVYGFTGHVTRAHSGSLRISLGQCLMMMGRYFFRRELLEFQLPPGGAADWAPGQPGTAWKTLQPWEAWTVGYASTSISHLSTQYVLVPVQATKNGQAYNPTSDPVQFAFAPTATYVPQSGDWVSGSWVTTSNAIYPYSAQCLIGPGGISALGIGTYIIYLKISDSPETPVLQAGSLEIT